MAQPHIFTTIHNSQGYLEEVPTTMYCRRTLREHYLGSDGSRCLSEDLGAGDVVIGIKIAPLQYQEHIFVVAILMPP